MAAVTSSLVSAGMLHAQEAGTWVVVMQQTAIKSGDAVVETVERGLPLLVREVNGDQLGVTHSRAGWISRDAVLPAEDAIAHLTEQIKANPQDAHPLVARGLIRNATGDHSGAIEDYTEALRIEPRNRSVYGNRAIAWKQKGEYDIAIADYNDALRLDPTVSRTWHNRANTWLLKGEYAKAISDLKESIRLSPNDFDGYNAMAWLQATCPNGKLRNGAEAVRNATRACELCRYGHWYCLSTLAAAHAEAGDFKQAVEWTRRALEIAPQNRRDEIAKRLPVFESGRPWHAVLPTQEEVALSK